MYRVLPPNIYITSRQAVVICVGLLALIMLSCSETPIGENPPLVQSPANGRGWEFQNPYPTAENLIDVDFIDDMNGWIISDKGSVFHTDDGGATWGEQDAGLLNTPLELQFVSRRVGWIRSAPPIYIQFTPCESKKQPLHYTTDGGKTWQVAEVRLNEITGMQFVSENVGYISGNWCDSGIVMKTTDGGENWRVVRAFERSEMTSISFLDEGRGWALAHSVEFIEENGMFIGAKFTALISKTIDGGENWETVTLPVEPEAMRKIHFLDAQRGWISSSRSMKIEVPLNRRMIFTTKDGGDSWVPTEVSARRPNFYSMKEVRFFDDLNGWGVGNGLAKTNDGGVTWESVWAIGSNGRRRPELLGMDFTTSSSGWVVGAGGYVGHTLNGGKTWNERSTYSFGPTQYMKFFDRESGVGLSSAHFVFVTDDAGRHWTNKRIQIPNLRIGDGHFESVKNGWLFGASDMLGQRQGATILRTFDAGESWEVKFISSEINNPVNVSKYSKLQSGMFVDETHGWAVGDAGTLVSTKDGGETWTPTIISQKNLRSVSFVNPNTGWVVGADGVILFSMDGGASWNAQVSNTNSTLMDVEFATPDIGWIVGDEGVFLRTTNGGVIWERVKANFGSLITLEDVEFSSSLIGWTCGRWSVYGTQDGGQTWSEQFYGLLSINTKLTTLSFINDDVGWVGGSMLLRTTNGGRKPN